MDNVFHTGVVDDVVIAGCYGFNADYFAYPAFRPSAFALPFIITLGIIYFGLYAVVLNLSSSSEQHISLTYSAISLLATLDMGSDLFDLFFSLYASKALFWSSLTFTLIIPVLYFTFAVVVCQRLIPHDVIDFYEWYVDRVAVTRKSEWDIKRVVLLIPFALSLVLLLLPCYMVLLIVGAFLYHTKLLAHKDMWNTWVLLFTGRSGRYSKKSVFDTKLLNDAMFLQLLMTSVPLVTIKIVNFTLNDARGLFTSEAFKFYYNFGSSNNNDRTSFYVWVRNYHSPTYSFTYLHPAPCCSHCCR